MKSRRSVIGVFLLLAGIGLIVAGLAKLLQRNEYKAVAIIKIEPSPRLPGDPNGYDPYFLLTEFQTIQSHAVLKNVILELKLDVLWGNKYNHGVRLIDSETEEMIKRHLELRNIRNTKLIEISVFDNDPVEAAKLANAIARAYCEYRREEFQEIQRGASQAGKSSEPLKVEMPEVVDSAVPLARPMAPNRYLGGAMLGCGLFLIVIGISSLKKSKN